MIHYNRIFCKLDASSVSFCCTCMPKAESGLTFGKLNKSVDLTKKWPAMIWCKKVLGWKAKYIHIKMLSHWNILMENGKQYCHVFSEADPFEVFSIHHGKCEVTFPVCNVFSSQLQIQSGNWYDYWKFHKVWMFMMALLTFLVRYLLSARSNLSAWGGLWWLWYPGKVWT